MQFSELQQQHICGITISRANERTFSCTITIDAHGTGNTARTEALALVYVKALLSGTNRYARDSFLDELNLLGASMSVSTQNNFITISIFSIDTHAKKLLVLLESMVNEPAFSSLELKRIRTLLANELHESNEDAKKVAIDQFKNALYKAGDRRYSASPSALEKELASITKKDLTRFHEYVTSGSWIFTLVAETKLSKYAQNRLITLRNRFLSRENRGLQNIPQPANGQNLILHAIPSKQNIEFSIGNVLNIPYGDMEYHAFLFGLQVLGKWGGFAGRLMSTVREKEGLTYGIYARTETASISETGYWRIMTFFAPNKARQGLQSTLREIKKISSTGITETEFRQFKTIMQTSDILMHDSILRTASDLHAFQTRGLTLSLIEEHKKTSASVTRTQVNAALKKYLSAQALVISGAGPTKGIEKELKALVRVAKKSK